MKIGRRGFISLGLGATAGLTLSPLPWKLLDDVSIWTQNWPWVPVPKDGEASEIDSICPLCPGGCGITICKVDQRVISIKGRKDFPTNLGGICPLGLSGPQLLYTPVRIMSPMLKVDGAFNQISWTQALDLLKTKLSELRKQSKSETLACLSDSDQGSVPLLLNQFLEAFGSPNFISNASPDDTWKAVTQFMFGSSFIPGFDLEKANYVLSFGCGLAEGWGSPVHTMRAHSQWKDNGTRVVQIEPRLSNTAAVADQWMAIKPGSEAVLALGLAGFILNKGLYKENQIGIDAKVIGSIRDFTNHNYSVESVSKKTGLLASDIEQLAREFSRASHPLALCGKGQGRLPGDSKEFSAVLLLNLLVGNLDQPGGIGRLTKIQPFDLPEPANSKQMLTGRFRQAIGTDVFPDLNQKAAPEGVFKTIVESDVSPVQLLLVNNSNPAYSQMACDSVIHALEKIPFVVNFSTYWDETAENSDLLLPNHSYLERFQDVTIYRGQKEPLAGLSKPASKIIFDTRQTGDIVIAVAHSLGGSVKRNFPWKNHLQCLKSIVGRSWEALDIKGYQSIQQPKVKSKLSAKNWNSAFKNIKNVLPQGDPADFPLLLLPKESMSLTTSALGSPPFMIKTVPDTTLNGKKSLVDIHPSTAQNLDLTEGQAIRLSTQIGETVVEVHLDEGTMPGIVVMPVGLGHQGPDEYLAGKGSNFNRLIAPVIDSQTGQNAAWGINCQLKKV